VPGGTEKIYLHKAPDATNEDIAEVRAAEDSRKMPALEIVFTKEGAKKIAKLSEEHFDKPLAVLVDGKVVSAPVIKSKFSERALVTGKFTKEEVEKIVKGFTGK
jgi:preprotein translocase subunit SecD